MAKYKSDWEYDYFSPLNTTSFIEKIEYHSTGKKRDTADDWILGYPLGILFVIIGLIINSDNSIVTGFIKMPIIVIGAIMLLVAIICTIVNLSDK